jgi:hypothetical protein
MDEARVPALASGIVLSDGFGSQSRGFLQEYLNPMSRYRTSLMLLGMSGLVIAALCLGQPSPNHVSASASLPSGLIGSAVVGQGAFGAIKGRLVWGGSNVPKLVALKPDKDLEVCGKEPLYDRSLTVDESTKGVAHAFAYLVTPKAKNADAEKAILAKTPKVTIDNVRCEFMPYATAAHQAQGFIFKSSDPIGHNAHYTGFTNNKNIALPPNGKVEDKLVFEKRPISLKCDIHPWMKGWIMVFNHPFFAVTQPDGSFVIEGVPAGDQQIIVWHEKAGYVTEGAAKGQKVTVKAGETVDLGEIKLDPAKVK